MSKTRGVDEASQEVDEGHHVSTLAPALDASNHYPQVRAKVDLLWTLNFSR